MEHIRIPKPGEIYNHFKGKLYQIITVAVHTETKESMVVYQALYGDFKTYVRPLEMFISEVDHIKYPEVKQKYRFELKISFEDIVKINTEPGAFNEKIGTELKLNDTVNLMNGDVSGSEVHQKTVLKSEVNNSEINNSEINNSEVYSNQLHRNEFHNNEVRSSNDTEVNKHELQGTTVQNNMEDNTATTELEVNSLLLKFLDAESYTKKLEVLTTNKKHITDRIINDMAVALDCAVNEGPIDRRIQELISCLEAKRRFEDRRFR